jgi:hypothetical protein
MIDFTTFVLLFLAIISQLSAESFMSYAENVYHENVKIRLGWFSKYNNDTSRIVPWDGKKGMYLWDWFPPAFNCPSRERVGRFGDGGKILCNWEYLKGLGKDCIIYSFGVNGEVSFEEALVAKTQCTIYAFDPTVDGLPRGTNANPCETCGKIVFEKAGLSHENVMTQGVQYYTVASILERTRYYRGRIPLIKID